MRAVVEEKMQFIAVINIMIFNKENQALMLEGRSELLL